MAKSAGKSSRSLAALAASMDTKKRPLPADARPADPARERIVSALTSRPPATPASATPAAPKQTVTAPAAPRARASAPRTAASPAPAAAPRTTFASPAPALRPRASAPRPRASAPRTSSAAPAPAARPVSSPLVVGRSAALSSLAKGPSTPAPTRFPLRPEVSDKLRRKYPRAGLSVRASLSLADDPTRVFEATLPTVNISVGGMFLESSFFLKTGTKLLVTLSLPPRGREVKAKGEVVRVETLGTGESGFALRFTEYLDGSEVALATHFLSPVLREFISAYAKKHRFDASPEYISHTADVLAAWELKKAELGGDVWELAGQP